MVLVPLLVMRIAPVKPAPQLLEITYLQLPPVVAVLEATLLRELLAGIELAGVELAGVELAGVLLRDELLAGVELPFEGVALNVLELAEPSAVVYFTQNQ